MTLKAKILTLINESRTGLTALRIFHKLSPEEHHDSDTIRIYVSSLKQQGFLKSDGSFPCEHCGSSHMHSRITDIGRMYVVDRLEKKS